MKCPPCPQCGTELTKDGEHLLPYDSGGVYHRSSACIAALRARLGETEKICEKWIDRCAEKDARAEKAEKERDEARTKWWEYERDYILPMFKWATEMGFDLTLLVAEAKGNCAERFYQAMKALVDVQIARSITLVTQLGEAEKERDAAIAVGDALRQRAKIAERQAEDALHWEDVDDEWTVRIDAVHPVRSGSHETYGVAMKMVGNRHSKGSLVALVSWLLVRVERAERKLEKP